MRSILESAAKGYSCLASWAGLLDRINVFPVADGDTGTNLRITLAPLQNEQLSHADLPGLLARTAVGNSGNIAAAFFQEFLRVKNPRHLADMAFAGYEKARQAVLDPRQGTMLDVFATLHNALAATPGPLTTVEFLPLCGELQNSVLATSELIPELEEAGVVDSGALAMFIFFEGFFTSLIEFPQTSSPIMRLFGEKLALSESWQPSAAPVHCLDLLLSPHDNSPLPDHEVLSALGESVVVNKQDGSLKIHLHTRDPQRVQSELTGMGRVDCWKDEDMAQQSLPAAYTQGQVHIMTDAAGSLDPATAAAEGITLLDSYIICEDVAMPESLCDHAGIYTRLGQGKQVTTAQASDFERHQHYASAVQQFSHVLYLAAGSVYTGNYAAASAWKQRHDSEERLTVLDSGAASGRLALMALRTARFAASGTPADKVIIFARKQQHICREYVFIDSLKYLAAGGRVSRMKYLVGDLLHMKPVITPLADGATKQGVVRNRREQLAFACEKYRNFGESADLFLLQYSDNRQWVEDVAAPALLKLHPDAAVLLLPLSLTSGVHMGPGTWAIAFAGKE